MDTDEENRKEAGAAALGLLAQRGARARNFESKGAKSAELVVGDDSLARPRWATRSPTLMQYYDKHWGVPITDDQQMFRLLSLLILQAGMTWGSALEKVEVLDDVFGGFAPYTLASFTVDDEARLLHDPRLIRNARKIRAVLGNAKVVHALEGEVSLAKVVWRHRPTTTPRPRHGSEVPAESVESAALAKELRALGFTFVGPRICYSLMQSAGVVDTNLLGAHRRGCSGLWDEDGKAAHHLRIEDGTLVPVPIPPGAESILHQGLPDLPISPTPVGAESMAS